MSWDDGQGPVWLKRLKEAYGNSIELVGEDGETKEIYRILAEYRLGGHAYAALQDDAMLREDEIAFFRVSVTEDGDYALESIEDEEEWEAAAEAYDELLFEGSADES